MEEIRWGIIGCGDVTEVKSGPAFNKVAHSRMTAVMRRNAEKAKDYAVRHGVPKWYSNAQELIEDPEVNALYIATPPLYHEEYAISAINAGKPVYVEKPMATNAAAAKRIAHASKEKGIKVSVAHYRREQPQFLHIREMIRSGVIGDVRMVSLRFFAPHQSSMIAKTEEPWRLDPAISGGGLFHDLAPHQLDLMTYFFGKATDAKGLSLNSSGLYGADDVVAGHALFENRILFSGDWCFTATPDAQKDECIIVGSKGTISFSIFRQQPVILTVDGKEQAFHFEPLQHVQQPMIQKVVEYFLDKSANPCTAEEGVHVMEMIDAFTGR